MLANPIRIVPSSLVVGAARRRWRCRPAPPRGAVAGGSEHPSESPWAPTIRSGPSLPCWSCRRGGPQRVRRRGMLVCSGWDAVTSGLRSTAGHLLCGPPTGRRPGRHRPPAVSRVFRSPIWVFRSAPDPLQSRRGILGGMAYQVTGGRFVGRAQELARLRELLARAVDGTPLVGLVGGGAGIGRTPPAEERAAAAAGA